MTCLVRCEGCARHVRAVENGCPFCGADLSRACARPRSRGRLSRQALLAAGAVAIASSGAACELRAEPVYGGPIPPADAGAETDADAD